MQNVARPRVAQRDPFTKLEVSILEELVCGVIHGASVDDVTSGTYVF